VAEYDGGTGDVTRYLKLGFGFGGVVVRLNIKVVWERWSDSAMRGGNPSESEAMGEDGVAKKERQRKSYSQALVRNSFF
jgi:hypothetical protein